MATRPTKPTKPKPRQPLKPVFKDTPNVLVDFIFDAGELFIAVENIGEAPALKVRTEFSAPLRGVMGTLDVNAMALFQNIEFLAPRKAIRMFLDTSAAYFSRNEPRQLAVRVRYRDMANRRYESTLHHDLSIYADIGYVAHDTRRETHPTREE